MTVCLPFSKIEFLTVNPRTGYILFGFIMVIIIYRNQDLCYLNDIGTGVSGQLGVPFGQFPNPVLEIFSV